MTYTKKSWIGVKNETNIWEYIIDQEIPYSKDAKSFIISHLKDQLPKGYPVNPHLELGYGWVIK